MNMDGEEVRRARSRTALSERKLILVAAVVAVVGGFFPWRQPLDLAIWGFDDGDGLITMSTAIVVFLLVWLEWRRITAGAAVALGGFLALVAVVNLTTDPGPGVVLAAVASLAMMAAGTSAFRKFGRIG
jgi:hypothetical protein